jgi:PIN domain nuclease of toxin-antitoxin system
LLWALSDDPRLSVKARKLIESAADIYVSAATFWEMAIKVGVGKTEC